MLEASTQYEHCSYPLGLEESCPVGHLSIQAEESEFSSGVVPEQD